MRILLLLFLLILPCCAPDANLTEQEKLLSSIKKLFKVLNLPHEGSLTQMNEIAQKELLRKPGQERWDMDKTAYTDKKEQILPILDEIGLLKEKKPSGQDYDYILIQGALVKRMRDRLAYLQSIWTSLSPQTRKKAKIVFLTGGRILEPTQESPDVLLNESLSPVPFRSEWSPPANLPQTEKEAAEFIWDQIIADPELRQKREQGEVLFVNAPLLGDPPRRPSAADTISFWIDSQRNPNFLEQPYQKFWRSAAVPLHNAHYLVISNNPFILYQQKVVQNSFKKKGITPASIETVGPAADPTLPLSVHLDNVARILYEEVASLKV